METDVEKRLRYKAEQKRFRSRFRCYLLLSSLEAPVGGALLVITILAGIASYSWLAVGLLGWRPISQPPGNDFFLAVGLFLYMLGCVAAYVFLFARLYDGLCYRVLRRRIRRLPADKQDMAELNCPLQDYSHRRRMERFEEEKYLRERRVR